jgi:hypothetical protein
LSEILAQSRPLVRGAAVVREFAVRTAEDETAGGGVSDG